MSRKRQRRDLEDPALKDYNAINNTKQPRYDLRYGQSRDCCSLPQYDKQPCHHKYHLRPFDHRKTLNCKPPPVPEFATRGGLCTNNQNSTVVDKSGVLKRNAHSYSINGHLARCSNSSTASGRQRTLKALQKSVTTRKKSGNHLKEEVSFKCLPPHSKYCGLMMQHSNSSAVAPALSRDVIS